MELENRKNELKPFFKVKITIKGKTIYIN